MKILHYALFYSSKAVTNYLYARDIDPNTILLNDYAFMERVIYITVSKTQSNLVNQAASMAHSPRSILSSDA